MHPDIEMAMLTGYPRKEYSEYERESSYQDQLIKPEYDDANALFKKIEEEI